MKFKIKPLMLVVSDAAFLFLSLVISCYFAAYLFDWFNAYWLIVLCLIIAIQLIAFLKLGLYRAVLRYASIDFLITVLKAVSIASLIFIIGFYLAHIHLPIRVLFVNWFITVFFIGGSRFFVRYFFELKNRFQNGRHVLIYGAGDMGMMALRQLKLNNAIKYSLMGFLDDDPAKHGKTINGIKVMGSMKDLESIIDSLLVEEVIVAIAEIKGEKLQEIVRRCRKKNVVCRIIPCFSKLLEIDPHMRSVELADLMRRLPRDLDMDEIRKYLSGKSVLITGAAGSIGSELVEQTLKHQPGKVIAFDQSEYGLYSLRERFGDFEVKYVLGDATNLSCVENVFKSEKPEIVFHAAAYKHVPLLEFNIIEAVRNNIGSTKILAEMSSKYNVKSFVLISTDKAVRPSSVMGTTKRICELIIQNFDRLSKTEFVAVRFGNVLGSSGSVVPKFLDQIKQGGPVTITHPDATRYFMLIDEAVQLVLQAAALGKGGEIFILNMGKPVKISELAEDLIFLMGRQPHKDINIEYVGLRPGEKIHEELLNETVEEKTRFEDITIGKSTMIEWSWFDGKINNLLDTSSKGVIVDVLKLLKEMVPEIKWHDQFFNDNMEDFYRAKANYLCVDC